MFPGNQRANAVLLMVYMARELLLLMVHRKRNFQLPMTNSQMERLVESWELGVGSWKLI
jgi:hypothetical protein